ncbi:MAG: cupredoxin domain-containing protein [Candidatus Diapherotrites archaeon]|nr:cupredoxin domain-containing protein [Candidatus Diapherotrites archaeon]
MRARVKGIAFWLAIILTAVPASAIGAYWTFGGFQNPFSPFTGIPSPQYYNAYYSNPYPTIPYYPSVPSAYGAFYSYPPTLVFMGPSNYYTQPPVTIPSPWTSSIPVYGPATSSFTDKALIANFSFLPQTSVISKGQTVKWANQDQALHTVTFDGSGFGSGILEKGGEYVHTFNMTGTFPYHCALHPFMQGTVIVK